ncbi:MAG: FkbM family methyltransferase [Rhodobacteraceae bacterium]|nr:FkbM family methyltransferase [Paracoccaceae bacterium]
MNETAGRAGRRERRRHRAEVFSARAQGTINGISLMLKPGDIAFDCGANVGDVSAILARSGATVEACEPDPYCVARLTERLAGVPNLRLHAAAVGVAGGVARLQRDRNFDADPARASVRSTVTPGGRRMAEDPDEAIEVPVIDLPAALEAAIATRGEIAFLKLDVEDAEPDILEEMARRRIFDGIRFTAAETHERKFPALAPRFAALRARIAAGWPATRVTLDWI